MVYTRKGFEPREMTEYLLAHNKKGLLNIYYVTPREILDLFKSFSHPEQIVPWLGDSWYQLQITTGDNLQNFPTIDNSLNKIKKKGPDTR